MAGKIWRYDCYDLRKFRPGDIDVFSRLEERRALG